MALGTSSSKSHQIIDFPKEKRVVKSRMWQQNLHSKHLLRLNGAKTFFSKAEFTTPNSDKLRIG
jgi:hypothetical protein